jgi:hypothetical protein
MFQTMPLPKTCTPRGEVRLPCGTGEVFICHQLLENFLLLLLSAWLLAGYGRQFSLRYNLKRKTKD